MKTVAVIQPYFFPYAGYFRLFEAADTVVMFDCVQFPRRGWVHRNRFAKANGELDWLTLPIVKADRDVLIEQLRFTNDATSRLGSDLRRFPVLEASRRAAHPLLAALLDTGADVTSYLCGLVQRVAAMLDLTRPIVRSSELNIDPGLHGQDRVIAIVRAIEGTHYVNPSGGRDLYDHETFDRRDLHLRFLTPYTASMDSILTRLLRETTEAVRAEIAAETQLVP